MSAPNPFTPRDREPVQDWRWRRPIRLACVAGIVALLFVMFSEAFVMLGSNVFRFTVEVESLDGPLPLRICILSAHNFRITRDVMDYPEPWSELVDRQLGYGFAYVEPFRGEPIPYEVQGTSEETLLRYKRIYRKQFVVLAEWPDGSKSAQIELLPEYSKLKTVRVHLFRNPPP